MKKLFAMIGMAAMLFASTAQADTLVVPINQSWSSTTLINVGFDFPANGGQIEDIKSISIDITHTFASDLGFNLTAPDGSVFNLIGSFTAGGGLDVDGLTWVESGGATPYLDNNGNGVVDDVPYNALSWGSGGPYDKDGWNIQIFDDFGGDGGTVNSITIEFNKTNIVPEPVSALVLLGLGTVVAVRRRR